jgi:hypothetical protein
MKKKKRYVIANNAREYNGATDLYCGDLGLCDCVGRLKRELSWPSSAGNSQPNENVVGYLLQLIRTVYFFLKALPYILQAPCSTRLVAKVLRLHGFSCLCGLHTVCHDRFSDRSPRSELRILQLSETLWAPQAFPKPEAQQWYCVMLEQESSSSHHDSLLLPCHSTLSLLILHLPSTTMASMAELASNGLQG